MIYLDASVLVSLYCPDANSAPATAMLRQTRDSMALSLLAELETVNAIGLRVFRKQMSRAQAAISLQSFEADLRSAVFQLTPLPETALHRARDLSRTYAPRIGIRTVDLLHVAAALELGAQKLYSFDLRQREVARAAGLKLNPLW